MRVDERTGRFPDASVTCGREGGNYVTAPVAIFEDPLARDLVH